MWTLVSASVMIVVKVCHSVDSHVMMTKSILGTDVKAICTCFFSSTLVVIRVAGWSGGGQLTAEVDSCGLLFSMLRKCSRWSVIGERNSNKWNDSSNNKEEIFLESLI